MLQRGNAQERKCLRLKGNSSCIQSRTVTVTQDSTVCLYLDDCPPPRAAEAASGVLTLQTLPQGHGNHGNRQNPDSVYV